MASACWMAGRIEEAVGYADAAQLVIASGRHDEVPFGGEAVLGTAYAFIGQPERWVEWCRTQLARDRDTHGITRTYLVFALTLAGCGEEARAAANGLIDTAEATHNPYVLSFALYVHGYAFRDADPAGALDAARRGLVIARDSGNRYAETLLAGVLSGLEAEHGDPLAALDYVTLAIGNFHDAGNTTGGAHHPRDPRRPVRPARTPRSGGHHGRPPHQPPHRSGLPRDQYRHRPPARCPRRPGLRIARPQG